MDRRRFEASPIGHLVPIRGVDGRTGKPYDHIAYVAEPLADEPELSSSTWRAVNAANRALARLDQASRQIPSPELLRRPTLRREAQSTSALEGTFAPLEQVLAADIQDGALSAELLEIFNYIDAANRAFEEVRHRRRISKGLLESSHGVLVHGTQADTVDAGRIRRGPVAIGSPTGTIEGARFVPMPPGTALEVSVQDLLDWIATAPSAREPIVAAAMAHYQFETLHPFNDGNGRIGRLMVVLQFMADDLLTEPLLSVSPWFEARRPEYQEHLASVSATGSWDAWIQFFAAGIESSSNDIARRVDRLLAVQSRYVELVQTIPRGRTVRDIIDILIGDPIVTVPMLARRLEKSQPAINTALGQLVDLGVVRGPIGSYNRRFLAEDMWTAITAPVGGVPDRDEPLARETVEAGDPDQAITLPGLEAEAFDPSEPPSARA